MSPMFTSLLSQLDSAVGSSPSPEVARKVAAIKLATINPQTWQEIMALILAIMQMIQSGGL